MDWKDFAVLFLRLATIGLLSMAVLIYQLPNDLLLECSHVDKGCDTEFMYAEIEFPSVQDAENFQPLPNFTADVTNDSSYKMKNFWKATRL